MLAQRAHPLGSYLLIFWHEHLLANTMSQRGKPHLALASHSKNGKLAGFIMKHAGFRMLYGSQGESKGGRKALIQMLKGLKNGNSLMLTVDGSTGPRREAKNGCIYLAKSSRAAIIPMASYASNVWVLRSWDKMKIPKPFSKIVLVYGKPITIPENETKDKMPYWQKQISALITLQAYKAKTHYEASSLTKVTC